MDYQEAIQSPVLDQEQIDILVESGGDDAAELLGDLFGMFQDEAKPKLESLRQSFVARDRAGVKKYAHAIAGSAANLGALRLAQLCRALEAMSQDEAQSWDTMKDVARQILADYHLAVKTINDLIAKL